jgi:hypothetical protein
MEARMRHFNNIALFSFALMVGFSSVTPANAQISADLAKKCRMLMLKAAPIRIYGNIGRGAAERRYFQQCINQQGKMPEDSHESKSGREN